MIVGDLVERRAGISQISKLMAVPWRSQHSAKSRHRIRAVRVIQEIPAGKKFWRRCLALRSDTPTILSIRRNDLSPGPFPRPGINENGSDPPSAMNRF